MFRSTTPLGLRILGGLFRITHIKQFISFGLSVSVLLWIIRLMHLKTFGIVVLIGVLAILALSAVERLLAEPVPDPERVRLLDPDPSLDRLSAEAPLFSPGAFRALCARSADTRCSMCERTFLPDDDVVLTECRHVFHQRCFDEWTSVEISCPTCQTSLA
jgi:hypothetical protein